MDWFGAGLLSGGLTGLLVGISEGSSWGWVAGSTVGCLAGGLVVLVGWGVYQSRASAPLVDISYLFQPRLVTIAAIAFAIHFGFDGSRALLSTFLALPGLRLGYGLGLPVGAIGMVLAAGFFIAFLAASAAAWVGRLIGYSATMVLGSVMSVGCFTALVFVRTSLVAFLVCLGLGLVGFGLIASTVRIVFVRTLRPGEVAAGVGILELGLDTGGAVGSASVGAIMAGRLLPHSATTAAAGYSLAWGLAAALAFVAVLMGVGLLVVERRVSDADIDTRSAKQKLP